MLKAEIKPRRLHESGGAGQSFIRPWHGYADQRTWALARCTGDWILVIDADEELTPDLIAEIESEITHAPQDVDGYYIACRTFFCGKWIRHCGWYPAYHLRLFRRGAGRYPNVNLHEGVVIEGRALYLKGRLPEWRTNVRNNFPTRNGFVRRSESANARPWGLRIRMTYFGSASVLIILSSIPSGESCVAICHTCVEVCPT